MTSLSTAPQRLHLSPSELRTYINPDDASELDELLVDHPALTPRFIHFQSLHRTARKLEDMLEDTLDELNDVFNDMMDHELEDAFAFFTARKRRQRLTTILTPEPLPNYEEHTPSQPSLYSGRPRSPGRTPFYAYLPAAVDDHCSRCGHTAHTRPRQREYTISPTGLPETLMGRTL